MEYMIFAYCVSGVIFFVLGGGAFVVVTAALSKMQKRLDGIQVALEARGGPAAGSSGGNG